MTAAVTRRLLLASALLAVGCGGGAAADDDQPDADDAAVDAAPLDGADAPPPDPCAEVAATCPSPGALVEGAGLVAIERCAFPMEDRDEWATRDATITALAATLTATDVAGVLGDLNRSAPRVAAAALPGAPPGVQQAFGWQAGDQSVAYWIPQGITGSGDGVASGRVGDRNVVLVSWYYSRADDPGSTLEKGVRLAIADVTDPDDVRYRLVLLVDPVAPATAGGRADLAPVRIHAGGIAWVGRYLYVADTGTGLRVFDLERILPVATGVDVLGHDAGTDAYYAHNYAYAVPQIDTIADVSSCAPRYSFVSLDRSTTPPSLLSGEYDATSVAGRLFRWPLDLASGRPALVAGDRLVPDGAWYAGQSHVQGALSRDGVFWLSSSKPPAAGGELYRTAPATPTATLPWIDAPEDLFYDPAADRVWSLSEGQGARYVIAVARTAID